MSGKRTGIGNTRLALQKNYSRDPSVANEVEFEAVEIPAHARLEAKERLVEKMLIPVGILLALFLVGFLIAGIAKKSLVLLAMFSILMWLGSLVSAIFVVWAWLERGYSENWAMYGVFFISFPLIATTGLLAIVALVASAVRRIENRKRICLSLYLLLLFLAGQMVFAWMAS